MKLKKDTGGLGVPPILFQGGEAAECFINKKTNLNGSDVSREPIQIGNY